MKSFDISFSRNNNPQESNFGSWEEMKKEKWTTHQIPKKVNFFLDAKFKKNGSAKIKKTIDNAVGKTIDKTMSETNKLIRHKLKMMKSFEVIKNTLKKQNSDLIDLLETEEFQKIFTEQIMQINTILHQRTINCFVSALCYLILNVYFDVNIQVMEIEPEMYSSYWRCLKDLRKTILIDAKKYDKKVIKYGITFLNKLKSYLEKLDVDIDIQKFKYSYKKFKQTKFGKNYENKELIKGKAKKTCETLKENGFNIVELYRNGCYKYFLPQFMALFIIYVLIKNMLYNTTQILSSTKICQICEIRLLPLKKLIEFVRNDFMIACNYKMKRLRIRNFKILKMQMKKIDKTDIKTIENLFKILGLEIKDFIRLFFYKRHDSLAQWAKVSNMRWMHFKQMVEASNNLTVEKKKSACDIVDKILQLRSKKFYHQHTVYRFVYRIDRVKKIFPNNIQIRNKIEHHLTSIWCGNFPENLFNTIQIRPSNFKIKGNFNHKLMTKDIENNLIKKLEISSKLTRNHYFIENLRNSIQNRSETDHSILIHLMKDKSKDGVLALEVPTWMKLKNNDYCTGHIDLLAIMSNTLIIADFKQNYSEMVKSITQVIAYAKMLKEQLKLNCKIMCALFTKKESISFYLDVIEDVKKYMENKIEENDIFLETTKYNDFKTVIS